MVEHFNPNNPNYKKVDDLPEEHQKDFVDVDDGFIRLSVKQTDRVFTDQAEQHNNSRSFINRLFQINKVKYTDLAEEAAYEDDGKFEAVRARANELLSRLEQYADIPEISHTNLEVRKRAKKLAEVLLNEDYDSFEDFFKDLDAINYFILYGPGCYSKIKSLRDADSINPKSRFLYDMAEKKVFIGKGLMKEFWSVTLHEIYTDALQSGERHQEYPYTLSATPINYNRQNKTLN